MNVFDPNSYRVIDLTHVISTGMPVWPGDPSTDVRKVRSVEEDGYLLNELTIGEHTGTHIGAPAHFVKGGRTVDRIPPMDLIARGIVIDVSKKSAYDPDYTLSVSDVLSWEKLNGRVPGRSVVLLRSGWDSRWKEGEDPFGLDESGAMHFPGFSEEAVVFLTEERNVLGLGTDTPGIDPGIEIKHLSNIALAEHGGFHLENLKNLGELPPRGFLLLIGALPIVGGSGSPARVLALVPR